MAVFINSKTNLDVFKICDRTLSNKGVYMICILQEYNFIRVNLVTDLVNLLSQHNYKRPHNTVYCYVVTKHIIDGNRAFKLLTKRIKQANLNSSNLNEGWYSTINRAAITKLLLELEKQV